jgi:hypothetical protein
MFKSLVKKNFLYARPLYRILRERKTLSPIWAYGRESKSVLLINNVYIFLHQINKWSDSVKQKSGDKELQTIYYFLISKLLLVLCCQNADLLISDERIETNLLQQIRHQRVLPLHNKLHLFF